MTFEYLVYYGALAAYLVLFGAIAISTHKMQRALSRIADRLDAPVDKVE